MFLRGRGKPLPYNPRFQLDCTCLNGEFAPLVFSAALSEEHDMSDLYARIEMQANFEGLIQLLARHLYNEPDIFIREMVQNANDAIERRRVTNPDHAGRITITISMTEKTITISDNGVGMDEADIRKFLSVIGSTGTGEAKYLLLSEGKAAAYSLIGQFGIGMLSAFIVVDHLVVNTRKSYDLPAFSWHNRGATECELYIADKKEIGTDVILYIRPEYTYFLDTTKLRSVVQHYCDFIPHPILLNGIGPINEMNAPWHMDPKIWSNDDERRLAYHGYLDRRFTDIPLDVIPLDLREPYQVSGSLYISDRHIPDIPTTGVVDIFVRRMLIRANEPNLLPKWAKFVRGIVESPELQPTAARDNLQITPSYDYIQNYLGEAVIKRLSYLAEHEPEKFARLNEWHHYHLKGMALFDEEFFKAVGHLLLFETNQGLMSLDAYKTKNSPREDLGNKTPVYYFDHEGAKAQFYRLADENGWVVINAGRAFEANIINKFVNSPQNHGALQEVRLHETDDPRLFKRLTSEEVQYFKQLELNMEGNLHRTQDLRNVVVEMRSYLPADVPAVIIQKPEGEAGNIFDKMLKGPWVIRGLDSITAEGAELTKAQPVSLRLNASNPIVQHLASLLNRKHPVPVDILISVYITALFFTHKTCLLKPTLIYCTLSM